ncbi:hypothetical protein H4R33_002241 [Dimargaris cristalligena]|uniref:Uncharacterized protein n=1 Tax=Dimargaris cristalligena TaxID=215637 RepID=A0A4P9ZK06_9FUNG|nr:hypothetical protein H4R33_002241 [Dimargaris cristalligena]RKP33403.1 hypothetical protein BJ085DRAFT_40850 [Dimargaris cristalligena]|eukprot:RKP33403.1 hypothetical protein BJ085DRAFT_40850 [Dimargaris cristalligena]
MVVTVLLKLLVPTLLVVVSPTPSVSVTQPVPTPNSRQNLDYGKAFRGLTYGYDYDSDGELPSPQNSVNGLAPESSQNDIELNSIYDLSTLNVIPVQDEVSLDPTAESNDFEDIAPSSVDEEYQTDSNCQSPKSSHRSPIRGVLRLCSNIGGRFYSPGSPSVSGETSDEDNNTLMDDIDAYFTSTVEQGSHRLPNKLAA